MRTKTLLLAGAALALSLATSQAQVYSANIVGYANVPMAAGYNLVANQFSSGANTALDVLPTLPDGTTLLTWNTTGSSFVINIYDTFGGANPPSQSWYMSDYFTLTNAPTLNPGQGFFLQLASAYTNTFVGSVVPNISAINTNNLVANYNLVGSTIPVATTVTNSAVNFYPPDGTTILTWNGTAYTFNIYDTFGGANTPDQSWYMSDYFTLTNVPSLKIGQGFFVQSPSTYSWQQTLQP